MNRNKERYFDKEQQMISRYRSAYEGKFEEHGLTILYESTFNDAQKDGAAEIESCHVWILRTQKERYACEKELARLEDKNEGFNMQDYKFMKEFLNGGA